MALAVASCHGCCHCCWQSSTSDSQQQREYATFLTSGTAIGRAASRGAQQRHTGSASPLAPLPGSERPGLCSETHPLWWKCVAMPCHSTPVARRTALPDFDPCEAKTVAATAFTLSSAWVLMLQMSISAERKQTSTFQLGWSGHPAPCGTQSRRRDMHWYGADDSPGSMQL